jgi:hypothetical protein
MKNKMFRVIAILVATASMVYASGEISVQGFIKAVKGARDVSRSPGTITLNWTGDKYAGPIIYTATSNYTPMAAVSFVTNGICWIRNVGTNSGITFSFDNGTTAHMAVKTNEFWSFRLAPNFTLTNLNYKLTTTSTNYTGNDFEMLILED